MRWFHARRLIRAIGRGDIATVRKLIATDHTLVDVGTRTSYPLAAAALTGQVEIAQLLIENGADVNLTPRDGGWSALHCTAMHDHSNIAELLLRHGAKLNYSSDGDTAMSIAKLYQSANVMAVLMQYGARG
jgi:ankyrin repeat protein